MHNHHSDCGTLYFFFFFFFAFGPDPKTPERLSSSALRLFLALLTELNFHRGPYGMLGTDLGQPHARHTPSLLYCCSNPGPFCWSPQWPSQCPDYLYCSCLHLYSLQDFLFSERLCLASLYIRVNFPLHDPRNCKGC